MVLRFSSRHRWVALCLGVVLLGIPLASVSLIETEYRATYSAQPIAGDDAHSPVAVEELPATCQPVAYHLLAGHTVVEQGYELRTGGTPLFVTHTNISNTWRLSNIVCSEQIATGRTLQADGQYYRIWGTEQHGMFWYRHAALLSLSTVVGATLILSSLTRLERQDRGE